MKRNAVLLCAGALAVGLIAAGCGGNDDESSDTGTEAVALTKEEFIQKADAICTQSGNEIDQAGKAAGLDQNAASAADLEQFTTETVVPGIQGQLDDIRALGAPEGDEDEVNAILDAAQEANDEIKADPSLLANEGADPFADANKLAQDYGLKACGQ